MGQASTILRRVISGGQTGADRGGLDAAVELGLEVGGYCPRGRRAEDGVIPRRYPLVETPGARYAERTDANVRESDATVVFTRGPAAGGSELTVRRAAVHGRPVLHLDLSRLPDDEAAGRLRGWLTEHRVAVLNVAGSRESGAPGLSEQVRRIVVQAVRNDRG